MTRCCCCYCCWNYIPPSNHEIIGIHSASSMLSSQQYLNQKTFFWLWSGRRGPTQTDYKSNTNKCVDACARIHQGADAHFWNCFSFGVLFTGSGCSSLLVHQLHTYTHFHLPLDNHSVVLSFTVYLESWRKDRQIKLRRLSSHFNNIIIIIAGGQWLFGIITLLYYVSNLFDYKKSF